MSRMLTVGLALTGVICVHASAASAQGIIKTQRLSAAIASEIALESVLDCAKKGYKVTAAVVDLEGRQQAFLRGDGAPIHSSDNAYYKAYTAASLTLSRKEETTKAINERMAKAAPSTVPSTPLPNVTYAVGGLAIMVNGEIIGGLGISGAPGGQFDEDCGKVALAKVKDRMK